VLGRNGKVVYPGPFVTEKKFVKMDSFAGIAYAFQNPVVINIVTVDAERYAI
jgi:hypothetical protein